VINRFGKSGKDGEITTLRLLSSGAKEREKPARMPGKVEEIPIGGAAVNRGIWLGKRAARQSYDKPDSVGATWD
jgi:hypothetical protein